MTMPPLGIIGWFLLLRDFRSNNTVRLHINMFKTIGRASVDFHCIFLNISNMLTLCYSIMCMLN